MCTNPFRIRNRRYKSLGHLLDTYIEVPCGQCDECLRKRAADLYVRARCEYNECVRNGGIGFMCCLTYSDDIIPRLFINGKYEFVFNKKHVIDFIKRLRSNLDRYYLKNFGHSAPDFKYLVTSEFGQDERFTQRSHYHPLFFFRDYISFNVFHTAFVESLVNRKTGKRYFGEIYQCDVIDPSRGGIHYSSKYVCKDLMFEHQREYITKMIKFKKDYVNNKYSINPFPSNCEEEFRNRCIRSRKDYRQDVARYVRPYRHMLQFYMLSNDLGISSIISRYGQSLLSMPVINFEGFPYSIPKLVKQRFEQNFGIEKRITLERKIFIKFLERIGNDLIYENKIDPLEFHDIKVFAENYILPVGGKFKLVNPYGLSFPQRLKNGIYFQSWDDVINEFNFYDENNFFDLRKRLYSIIRLWDSEDRRKFRSSIASKKSKREHEEYCRKKQNKGY